MKALAKTESIWNFLPPGHKDLVANTYLLVLRKVRDHYIAIIIIIIYLPYPKHGTGSIEGFKW